MKKIFLFFLDIFNIYKKKRFKILTYEIYFALRYFKSGNYFKFRNHDKPTDVLSFPFFSLNYLKSVGKKEVYIGDIATSYEIIASKSKKKNFLLEFDKVWVHGLLHLVGYDHIKDKDYFKMNRIEKKILNLIN